MSMWLTKAELVEMTEKKQNAKIVHVLSRMRLSNGQKVRYIVHPDTGFPKVPRSQFEYLPAKAREPDFAALNE